MFTVVRHSKATPGARFDVIHTDIVGPLQGFTYLLTCVDHYTRWLEAIPLTTETVAQLMDLSFWHSINQTSQTVEDNLNPSYGTV